jgi:DNA-binding NtrC family response regulator
LHELLRTPRAVLLFSEDPLYSKSTSEHLHEAGFQVMNSGNGFETIEWSTSGKVDAVLLDLDHNHSEVTLIAEEIKRLRPELPTIVLVAGPAPDGVLKLADVLVPKERYDEVLGSLEKILLDT